jgi:hypothetical protein
MPPFERDPLSVKYDAWSARQLGRAIAAPGAWQPARVVSPRTDPVDGTTHHLTQHERAAVRSLYYTLKANRTQWSLQVDWGSPAYTGVGLGRVGFGERHRVIHLRVVTHASAQLAMRGRADAYTAFPSERSRGELPGDGWEPRQGRE